MESELLAALQAHRDKRWEQFGPVEQVNPDQWEDAGQPQNDVL